MTPALALFALALAAPALSDPPDCGPRARVSTSAPTQGGIVLLEVEATASGAAPAASWRGKAVRFWREDPGRWRALLGIDLEQPAGDARIVFTRGLGLACGVRLSVRGGEFPEEHLRLPDRYVELGPRDQARAAREAARLATVLRTVTAERLWQGPFQLPIEGVEPSSSFGRRRVLNGRRRSPHTGVDLGAPTGTPIRATQRGRVALDADLFFSGRTVVLDHGLGLFSLYGHLSASRAPQGRLVQAGEVIGLVGATGRVTAPHLHWAVRIGDARVDGLDLVRVTQP